MIEPREIELEAMAVASLQQLIGIMTDHMWTPDYDGRWDVEQIVDLEQRIADAADTGVATLGIDDASLLLAGMAYTEVMSEDFPWIDTVRWVSDFLAAELRRHWTDEEWARQVAR